METRRGRVKIGVEMAEEIIQQEKPIHDEIGPLLTDIIDDMKNQRLRSADIKLNWLAINNKDKFSKVINLRYDGELILNKAIVNYRRHDNQSILLLLKFGADPEKTDMQNESAFALARTFRPDLLKVLKEYSDIQKQQQAQARENLAQKKESSWIKFTLAGNNNIRKSVPDIEPQRDVSISRKKSRTF